MAYPADVLLPVNAKYFGAINPKYAYNPNWDIVWSVTYALTGVQHGFCTFLTNKSTLTGAIPGHYMGYSGNMVYIESESGEYILDELGNRLIVEGSVTLSSYDTSGMLGIAFDSTGLFALSGTNRPGIGLSQIKLNSLIIRDSNDDVIFNESLSSLDTNFILASSTKVYQTLRFRYSNAGRMVYVDYKNDQSDYKPLASVSLPTFNPNNYPVLYPALTYCSPISSSSIQPSKLWLKNFHIQGNTSPPTYENFEFVPLSSSVLTNYTTVSGITAIPII